MHCWIAFWLCHENCCEQIKLGDFKTSASWLKKAIVPVLHYEGPRKQIGPSTFLRPYSWMPHYLHSAFILKVVFRNPHLVWEPLWGLLTLVNKVEWKAYFVPHGSLFPPLGYFHTGNRWDRYTCFKGSDEENGKPFTCSSDHQPLINKSLEILESHSLEN